MDSVRFVTPGIRRTASGHDTVIVFRKMERKQQEVPSRHLFSSFLPPFFAELVMAWNICGSLFTVERAGAFHEKPNEKVFCRNVASIVPPTQSACLMTKSLKNVKKVKCTLKDLEYGEKTENHGK